MAKKKVENHGLPSRVFAKWEDASDELWFRAEENEDDLVTTDEEFIGVYELKEIHAAKLVTTSRIVSKKVDA